MAAPRQRPILRKSAISQVECVRCGACCCNPPSNAAEGFYHWVEIGEREPILSEKAQKKGMDRLITRDEEGVAHLRLDPEGRCLALRGRLGRRVHCTIYATRPRACRLVEAGSDECMQARASRGIQ